MASAAIGSLFVNLGINTAQFNKGLGAAQSKLGGFGAALKSFAVGALAALSVGAITTAFKSVIDHADELGKTAQKIGIPTEELSKLQFAADLADVSMEKLSVGVGILSKGMASIAGGGTGEKVGPALAAIGVSATTATGALRPTSEVMGDVAEAFQNMEDGAGKTALAMAIFGKSGKDLIPLLNAGRDGLSEAAAEAEKLGIVIDDKTAKASERFNDNLTRLHAAMTGFTTKAVTALIGSMSNLTDAFVRFVEDGSAEVFFSGLNTTIQTTIKEFNALVGVVKTLGDFWKALNADTPGFISDPEATLAPFRKAIDNIHNNFSGVSADFSSITKQLSEIDKIGVVKKPAPIIAAPDPEAIAASKKALKDIKDAQDDIAEAGARVFESTRTPIEEYQIELKKLDDLLKQGAITQDTYNRAVANLKTNFADVGKAADTLGQELSSTIGSKIQDIFGDAIDGTLDLKDALKDLLKSLAKVAINNVFQSLLAPTSISGGGFFSKLFGFAKGGTIMPGGSGGIDSQFVAFRKSPNERVDITKPGQSLSSGSGTSLVYHIDARGADPGQLALLRRDLQEMRSNLSRNVVNIVTSEKSKNPRFAT